MDAKARAIFRKIMANSVMVDNEANEKVPVTSFFNADQLAKDVHGSTTRRPCPGIH